MQRKTISYCLLGFTVGLLGYAESYAAEPSVAGTVDQVVSRMQAAVGRDELLRLDERAIEWFIAPVDRQVFTPP